MFQQGVQPDCRSTSTRNAVVIGLAYTLTFVGGSLYSAYAAESNEATAAGVCEDSFLGDVGSRRLFEGAGGNKTRVWEGTEISDLSESVRE